MEYVVLMKQVPAELNVRMNDDFTMNRKYTRNVTNPADVSALIMALDIRKKYGGEISCVTMGPGHAVAVLREAALAGADNLYHICDRRIAGADSFITSVVLSAMIDRLDDVALVLCGSKSVDGETGQVGAEIAAMLGFSCVTNAIALEEFSDSSAVCRTYCEGIARRCCLPVPAVITVCPSRNILPLPSRAAVRRAGSMKISGITLEDLQLGEISGSSSSPTKVIGVKQKDRSPRHVSFLSEDDLSGLADRIIEIKNSGKEY